MYNISKNQSACGDPLVAFEGPELVFGLVGPVGCNLKLIQEKLNIILEQYRYKTSLIRFSKLLLQIDKFRDDLETTAPGEYNRISKYMDAGTQIRSETRRSDILAQMAIAEMRKLRRQLSTSPRRELSENVPLNRHAYIMRSFKNPDEIALFRDTYGRAFFLISVYKPRQDRVDALVNRIRRTPTDKAEARQLAEQLVQRDEDEQVPGNFGQDVGHAFPLADFFIDSRKPAEVEEQLKRFLEVIFEYPYHTPTIDEFGMKLAQMTSMRSADMARQVGASIMTKSGEICAVGCNEVPKHGGGLYWETDANDDRDFREQHDSSVIMRRELLEDTISRLVELDVIDKTQCSKRPSELAAELLSNPKFAEARLLDVIEYGRSVHAEMAALTGAAKRGISVNDSLLFTTTFPCHLCTKHIVASGITRVIYVEPYPKSLAATLYRDSICVDPNLESTGHVNFVPFVGIAPRLYEFAFENKQKRRKDDGSVVDWKPSEANPKLKIYVPSYLFLEQDVVGNLLPSGLKNGGFDFGNDLEEMRNESK